MTPKEEIEGIESNQKIKSIPSGFLENKFCDSTLI
jgi:hypothetical protein